MRAFRSAYVIRPELGIEWTASAWDIPAFEFLRQYGLDEYAQLGKHIASGGAFILNFVLVNETGYFDNAAETKPMLHLWSLAVEEQFYIIWPLMLWLAWKLKINLLIITTLVAFVSFGLNIRFVDVEPAQIFFGPVGRFWEILSGSILAWLLLYQRDKLSALKLWIESKVVGLVYSQKGEGDGTIVANVMSLAGLSILAYGLVRIDSDSGFPGIWALLPVSGTLLVIAAGSKAFFNRALLMNPLAIWIGLISYPLYLWHWPILSFLRIVEGGVPTINARITAVVMSIILAWLTYKFVEKPVRFNDNPGRGRIVIMSLLSIMLLVSLFGLVVFKTEGRLLTETPKQIVADTAWFSPKRLECRFRRNDKALLQEPCSYFEGNNAVAVIGNSHSHELAYAIAEKISPKGLGILQYGVQGCGHVYSLKKQTQNFCYKWHEKVFNEVSADENVKYVVLSYRNEKKLHKKHRRRGLVRLARAFKASGKKVILVLQAPMPQRHRLCADCISYYW